MANKLKITESQFNRIKHRLLETEDVNHTLDSVKVGDVLKFKTSAGSDYTITVNHVDQNGNEILGDNHGNKIYLNFNSYDEQSKKLNYKQLDKTSKKYIDKTVDVKELDIERNGKIVDIRDKNAEPNGQTTEPTPTSQKDDISQPVDLDPNNTKEKEILNKGEKTDNVLKAYYKEIINDPDLKNAFYKAPTFWNYFMATLKGKPAKGSGLYPTLKMVNTHKNKEIDKQFAGFADKQNKRASFNLKQMISIPYKVKNSNETKTLDIHSGLQSAIVQQYAVGQGTTKVLINKNEGFKMVVKNKIPNAPNTFRCDFYVYLDNVTSDKYKIEDVVVEFGKSPGYEPEKTNS
jgi:hypothetical protein